MTFCRRLVLFVVLGLGLIGFIACMAAIVGLWFVNARLRNTTEAVFANIDDSLVAIQLRAERTRDRVKESAISAESIASSLRKWSARETGERLAQKFDVAEKSERLLSVMQRADALLELSSTSAESIEQALLALNAIELQIDTAMIDAVSEEIASLRNQLAEAMNCVERLRDAAAAIGEEEPLRERIEPSIHLALRAITTLSLIDSRIGKFETRLSETQEKLEALSVRTIAWIKVVSIAVTTLIIWMAAGQLALSRLAKTGLRPTRNTAGENRSQ